MNSFVEQQLKDVVAGITHNHDRYRFNKAWDSGSLPNRTKIINIISMVREVLFPDYFGKQDINKTSMEYYLGNLINNIFAMLHEQIICALKHEALKTSGLYVNIEERASSISAEFLGKLPGLMDILALDVQAAFDGDLAAEDKDEITFSYPGIFALFVYRLAHELYLLKVPLIPRIMTEYAHSRTGIDIHAGAQIGQHFFMSHGTGIVIGETSVIGNNVTFYQGVTIGAVSTRSGGQSRGVKRHPTIEDNVTIYSGASILGGETVIGHDAVIGSNVFITESIPPGTRVSLKNQELLLLQPGHKDFLPNFQD